MNLRLDADGHRLEFQPTEAKTTVGRSDECEYLLDDKSISRRHLEVYYRSKGWSVRDLDSTKGTFINGEKISEPTLLKNGDVIKLGNITFTVTIEGAEAATAKAREGTKVLAAVGGEKAVSRGFAETVNANVSDGPRAKRNTEIVHDDSDAEIERQERRRLAVTNQDDELMKYLKPILLVGVALLVFWFFYRLIIAEMTSPAPGGKPPATAPQEPAPK
jgi:predicted component of type VI protein secretion system